MEGERVHELDLHGKKLKVLGDLSKLKSLRILDVSCNQLTKIEGLSESKVLRELKLYGNQITGIGGLESLSELCVLLLQFNKVSLLRHGLAGCRKLQVLRLDNNLLELVSAGDLTACSGSLVQLDLGYNQLRAIEGLGSLKNLVDLNLENNHLVDVQILTCCKKLVHLNLSDNPLNLHQLSLLKMRLLETLKLGSVSLSSLSHLPSLPHLQDLHVPNNPLHSVDEASTLFPSLELLNIKANRLETTESLTCLGGLRSLVELRAEGNPFCLLSSSDYRARITELLPGVEILDGVHMASKTGLATESSAHAPPMRTLTPSALGPSLRQVEGQLWDAEMQMQQFISDIGAKFKVLREAEQGKRLGKENGTKPSPKTGPDQAMTEANRTDVKANRTDVKANRTDISGTNREADTRPQSVTSREPETNRADIGADIRPREANRTDIRPCEANRTPQTDIRTPKTDTRPQTSERSPSRTGSRTRLQEALSYSSMRTEEDIGPKCLRTKSSN